MKKNVAVSVLASVSLAAVFALSGCSSSAEALTVSSAQQKLSAANVTCDSLDEQDLSSLLGNSEDSAGGGLLVCSDEGFTFGLGIFNEPQDFDAFIATICDSALTEANIAQLQEYQLIWGPNWFVDPTANPDITDELNSALGGDVASFYSRC